MAENRFTDEQKLAVTAAGNVIVSAGAGSGKTTVMIERIIQKLKAGAKLEEMLIVTFTRASAADIKEKLVKKLNAFKRENPVLARAALDAMPISNIGTLHSFCQRLVKNYFYVAGVDPSAAVCEDGEASIYKRAAVRAAVDEALGGGDKYVRELYDALCPRRGDDEFIDAVESAVDYALSMPEPDEYLKNERSDKDALIELKKIYKSKYAVLSDKIQRLIEHAHQIQFAKAEAECGRLLQFVGGALTWQDIKGVQLRPKTPEETALNEEYKTVKGDCKKFVEECDNIRAASKRDSAPYSLALRNIAFDAKERYAAKKSALNKLDYSDLEHGAKKVLSDEKCKTELAQKIKYVFIDEFQDINPLQAHIAGELEGLGAEMFLVGDAKQSIYGFRRCSPEHFMKKLAQAVDATAAKALSVKPEKAYTKIILNKNFRSSNEVIDFVNGVFTGLMTERYGGVNYADEPLVVGLNGSGSAGLFRVDALEGDGGADGVYSVKNADEKTDADAEARYVADRILEYIKADKKHSYKDIAVLVRGMNTKFCSDLRTVFERDGIPAHFGKNPRISDCPEAVALLDILRCVDNRYDDLALYTALRSPMGAFSDDELMEIARVGGASLKRRGEIFLSDGKRPCFWQKAEAYFGGLKDRLDAFNKRREDFARFALGHDAAETIGHITSGIGYFQYVYESFGSDAAANVQSLINAAAGYDTHAFIKRYDDTDFELESSLGGDAVSVMTMHGSKGLEFDLCIVANIAHKFNMSDATDRIIVSDGGVSVKVPNAENKTLEPSLPWLAENIRLPNKLEQEELRLFYVALTRAKGTLVVTAKNNAATKNQSMLRFIDGKCESVAVTVDSNATPKIQNVLQAVDGECESFAEGVERAVKAKCDFVYGGDDRAVKCSVTSLVGYHGEDESSFVPVMFDDENDGDCESEKAVAIKSSAGADKRTLGTLYHKAMELIDFENPDYSALGADDMSEVDVNVISRAVQKMRAVTKNAAHVFKERYFIADLPVDGVDTLVQGVIDLLVLDGNGGAVIVDYKTTKLQSLFTDGYKRQLKLYAQAVEKSTGLKVTHAYLYSFINDTLYEVKI